MCAALPVSGVKKVALVGMPGAGKSSVGLLVAEKLQWDFVDVDGDIEKEAGMSIADIFESHDYGELKFRALEHEAIAALIRSPELLVCATGGGAVENEVTRKLLAAPEVFVVWLSADLEALLDRTANSANRPLLRSDPRQAIKVLMDRRVPLYKSITDVTIDTDTASIEEVADNVIHALRHR